MGKELVQKILSAVSKTTWPQNPKTTDLGRHTYEISLDSLFSYRDDPKVLAGALRTLQTSDSRPFALAGVAYTLVLASREADGSYAAEGLDAALQWLEKAQETEPDVPIINIVEAFIYIHSNRLDDARLVLDYLQEQEATSYFLQLAEIAYWWRQEDLSQVISWFDRATQAAHTIPQRLRLLSQMGDCYLEFKEAAKALEKYREAVHFDTENHWLWHKMSTIYLAQENYEEAVRCNKKALKIKDFPEGRAVETALKEKLGDTGVLGRLFGRG